MRYKLLTDTIVDSTTGSVVMHLSLPKWQTTLEFNLKVLNGELLPHWIDDVLIWLPSREVSSRG